VIVYSDLITGDQVLSDSHPQKPLVFNGEPIAGVFVVQSRMVTKGPVQVNTGANASTEGGEDEGVDDQAVKVVDLKDPELGFGYEGPQGYSEGEFNALYKSWCRAVKEKIESKNQKPKDFMQAAKAFLPFMKEQFSNFEVYHGKSFSAESFVLGWWDDEANEAGAPKFIFFEPALIKEKY